MNEVLQGGHPHLELGTEHHCDPPVLSLCVFLLTRCSDLLETTHLEQDVSAEMHIPNGLHKIGFNLLLHQVRVALHQLHHFLAIFSPWIVLNLKGDSGRLSNPQELSNSGLPPGVGVAGRARNLRNLQPKRNLRNHSSKKPPTLSI